MRRTVLVVDDEPMVTIAIHRMLEPEGWDVLAAGDGMGALDLCISGYPGEPVPEFCDSIVKPFNPVDLIATADALVRSEPAPITDLGH